MSLSIVVRSGNATEKCLYLSSTALLPLQGVLTARRVRVAFIGFVAGAIFNRIVQQWNYFYFS